MKGAPQKNKEHGLCCLAELDQSWVQITTLPHTTSCVPLCIAYLLQNLFLCKKGEIVERNAGSW